MDLDWPRAKTILILAFAALNVFLAYRVWVVPSQPAELTAVSPEEAREVLTDVARRGLIVQASIPRRVPPQPFLLVGQDRLDAERLVAAFFDPGEDVVKEYGEQGVVSCYAGDRSLHVWDVGVLEYSRPRSGPSGLTAPGWDEIAARKTVERFIKAHAGMPRDAVYDGAFRDPETGDYLVLYRQEYRGHPLYGGYIRAVATPAGVQRYVQSWLSPKGFEGPKKSVIPPTRALQKVASIAGGSRGGETTAIVEVALGFYTQPYDAAEWQAVPVWRIRLEDGRSYLVNAYTGELEKARFVEELGPF